MPECWVVDPDAKTIEVLVNFGEGFGQHAVFEGATTARAHQFKSIRVPLAKLFAQLGPNRSGARRR